MKSTEIQQAELAFNTTTKAKTKQKKRKAGEEGHTGGESPSREKSRKKMAPKISPLAFRNKGMKMLVGAHVSVAKGLEKVSPVRTTGILISFWETGVQNAITNNHSIGGNVFAMFLKSHRKWTSPDLKESDVVAFWDGCIGAGIDPKRFVEPPLGLTFDRRLRNPDLDSG